MAAIDEVWNEIPMNGTCNQRLALAPPICVHLKSVSANNPQTKVNPIREITLK